MKRTILLAHLTVAAFLAAALHTGPARAEQDGSAKDQFGFAAYDERILELEKRIEQLSDEKSGYSQRISDCDCDCSRAGWLVSAEYLNWQVERDDLAFAIRDPDGNGVPSGGQPVMSLDLGPDSGFRCSFGRRTVSGWEVSATYTRLRSDDRRSFAPGGSQVLAVLSSPATGLTNADSVVASSKFGYDLVSLEAGHWMCLNDAVSCMAFGGVRFGWIDHRLQARYDGGQFVDGLIDVPTTLDAFGGCVGGSLHWHMTKALGLVGKSALSLYAAEIEAGRREENAGTTIIDASRQSDQIIPAIDLSLAIRYSRAGWALEAGYEWTNWFEAASPLEFSDSFNGGTLAPSGQSLGLHGFFLSAALDF